MRSLKAIYRSRCIKPTINSKLPLISTFKVPFTAHASRTKQWISSSNNQVLSEPYPSFLESLPEKSSIIRQRKHILESITDATHSNIVIAVIQKAYQDTPDLLNTAIFSVAVKKCNELKQHLQCIYLMELMFQYGIPRDLIQYNMVLLSLSKCEGQLEQTMKYFKKMIKKDKIIPDIYTFTHLIQSYRTNSMNYTLNDFDHIEKQQESEKMIKKCEKIWDVLVHKFGIKPDRLALSEKALMYANYKKSETALRVWDEMIHVYEVQPRITTCGLMIKAFSKYGDYDSCNKIIAYMKRNDMRINQVILCSLMHCYMNGNLHSKAIEIFDKFAIHNRNKKDFNDIEDMIIEGNDILFGLKAICYSKLLEGAIENKQMDLVKYYMDQIHETIPYERTEYKLSVSDLTLAELQLKTKLMTNGYNYDDQELKRFFEKKMKDKSLWCIRKNHQKSTEKLLEISGDKEEDDLLVGVHLYSNETAKFVLKYVFENKLNNNTFKKGTIIPIIIGRNLKLEDVRNVLNSTKIPFADLRLAPHNEGKVLFEPE